MAPPNKETLARLEAADGGIYSKNEILQALLDAAGSEQRALEELRKNEC